MKEEEIKKIVQQSKVETSTNFTDRLMIKIEEKKAQKPAFKWMFPLVLSILSLFSLVISFMLFINFGSTFLLSPFNLKIPGTLVFIIITVLLLFAINYWLQLKHGYEALQRAN